MTAHQDCAQSWVTDCERSGQPLLCPVCKYKVELEGRWDPIVQLNDAVARRFTRASPFLLLSGVSVGVHLCLHAYGLVALWAFAGEEAALRFVMGRQPSPGRRADFLSRITRERFGDSLVLVNVGPALLLSQLFPRFSNRLFMPMASLVSSYCPSACQIQKMYFCTYKVLADCAPSSTACGM